MKQFQVGNFVRRKMIKVIPKGIQQLEEEEALPKLKDSRDKLFKGTVNQENFDNKST